MFKNNAFRLLVVILAAFFAANSVFAGEAPSKRAAKAREKIKISVHTVGPTQATIDAAKVRMLESPAVLKELAGKSFYVISIEAVENGTPEPTEFRAVIVDYSTDRTLVVTGDLAGTRPVTLQAEAFQPEPSDEEFNAAVAVLQADSNFSNSFSANSVKAFRPMPPITVLAGTLERLVNVGMMSNGANGRNEVVSVSLKRGQVIRYAENAPPSAVSSPDACGVPNAGQSTTSSGTAGQYQLSVTDQQGALWDMLVIRPSVSSGSSRRSGIEVRDVKYRGKSVLKCGHAPVLNVEYVGGQCGPYRDWQYQEGMFDAPATGATYPNGPTGGMAVLATGQIAKTAVENGTDTGNFKGVAIYQQGGEVVLVSEMEAGWYRYIMEWRFGPDGSIKPRYGFGATDNSCVCFAHNHHVYWRLDFDIVGTTNNVRIVDNTRGAKPVQAVEFMTDKNLVSNKGLQISNTNGSESYLLIPNATDGVVDTFGVHDIWVLAFKGTAAAPTELEDGITCVTCSTAFIQINPFVNNESINNTDVVVWYGAHFLHNDGGNVANPGNPQNILTGSHVVGPNIFPGKW